MEWISVKDRLPEYDYADQRAFKYWIRATNERYYSGYIDEDGTTFRQHKGRKILNASHWAEIEPPK